MAFADKPHVLIVDDNPQNLQVLLGTLDQFDYSITAVMSGVKALEALATEPTDLILLDVMMPDMDGYETCTRIKGNQNFKDIPVIFLTAKTEIEDIVKGFEVGAVDYVSKPFQEAELLARIKTHIDLKRARDEIETLRDIIPICSSCKKIRNEEGYWDQVDEYLQSHTAVQFSHSMCAECFAKNYPELAETT